MVNISLSGGWWLHKIYIRNIQKNRKSLHFSWWLHKILYKKHRMQKYSHLPCWWLREIIITSLFLKVFIKQGGYIIHPVFCWIFSIFFSSSSKNQNNFGGFGYFFVTLLPKTGILVFSSPLPPAGKLLDSRASREDNSDGEIKDNWASLSISLPFSI